MYNYDADKEFQQGYISWKKEKNITDDTELNRYKVIYHCKKLRELGQNPYGIKQVPKKVEL